MSKDLKALQTQVRLMLAARPVMPQPFWPESDEAKAWQKAYEKWRLKYEDLQAQLSVADYKPKKCIGFWDDPYKDIL